MTLMLFTALALGPAQAAPVGDPIANPKTGRVFIDGSYGVSRILEEDSLCSGGACTARLDRSSFQAELGVAVVTGLGLYAFSSWNSDVVAEARLVSHVNLLGGGMRLGLPLGQRAWLAADCRLSFGTGLSDETLQVTDPASVDERIGTASVLGVWGHPDDGGHLWLGLQAPWMYTRDLQPLGASGVRVTMPMAPHVPVVFVVGGTLISERLGIPWGNSPRLRTTIEARLGQENALTVSTGLGF